MKIKRFSLLLPLVMFCLLQPVSLFALEASDFFSDHARGWFWYEAPPVEPESKESEPAVLQGDTAASEEPDPLEELNAVRQTIQRALAKAMLKPTHENVADYLTKQHELVNGAERFAHSWAEVLLEHPALNDALKRPTNAVGAQVYLAEKQKATLSAIEKLSQESGLFFFYRSACPYCQRFAPILKAFAERHHLTVIPITTDGISLPEFPNSLPDNGQSIKFNVQVEPAVFAVNPYTQKAYPIAYGLVSEEELSQRILDMAKDITDGEKVS